jgi:hypothetical protein
MKIELRQSMRECYLESNSAKNMGKSNVHPEVFASSVFLTSSLSVPSSDSNRNRQDVLRHSLTVFGSSQTSYRNEESPGSLQDPLDTKQKEKQ